MSPLRTCPGLNFCTYCRACTITQRCGVVKYLSTIVQIYVTNFCFPTEIAFTVVSSYGERNPENTKRIRLQDELRLEVHWKEKD
ncbi:hypothetical protein T4E_4037 [Trichinella pseudospiralis]|uniref:Uncharacterized protein n=1 Tax=Trichinella pseudospiralis TaxID=6337 RepID=A0A0V0YGS9_TRIPS|nr:hypothetical protein T4E_4037 [Trichinella pseudospiralis]